MGGGIAGAPTASAPNTELQAVTFQRQLAEIQMRLTLDAAQRLSAKGIDINTIYKGIDSDPEYNRIFRNLPLTVDEVS